MPDQLHFTAKDIPADIADLLQHAAGQADQASWKVGELTNLIIDDLAAEGVDYNKTSLYKAVAAHAGCASETVRMRAHVQRRFPKELRDEWPWISFHQAKALVPIGKDDPAEYERLIQGWATHSADTHISVTSVDGLRAWLHHQEGAPSAALVRYRRMLAQVYRVQSDQETPGFVVQLLRQLLKDLDYGAQQQEKMEWAPETGT